MKTILLQQKMTPHCLTVAKRDFFLLFIFFFFGNTMGGL